MSWCKGKRFSNKFFQKIDISTIMAPRFLFLSILLLMIQTPQSKAQTFEGIGISAGPETGLGLPKFQIVKYLINDTSNFYWGADASIWLLFTYWGSVNGYIGYENNKFISEITTGIWAQPGQDAGGTGQMIGPNSHWSLTPKIGFRFGKMKIKSGPSIILLNKYTDSESFLDLFKFGNIRMNFEIMYSINIFHPF